MNITYRNFSTDDTDKIIDFWNSNSGWETDMDRVEFQKRFCSSPFGEPIITLAINTDNDDELVGQFCFIPLLATIHSKRTLIYRPFGAILKESFRGKFGVASFLLHNHPMQLLYNKGAEEAVKKGALLSYMIPDPRWGRVLKTMPFKMENFPLMSKPLPLQNFEILPDNCKIEAVAYNAEILDSLWLQAEKIIPCGLVRNTDFFKWKNILAHGRFKLRILFQDDVLIGAFSLQFKTDALEWIIGDIILADRNNMNLLLVAACYAAQTEFESKDLEKEKQYKVAIMGSLVLINNLDLLGFKKDNYNFTLAVHRFNKKFTDKEISPRNWHIYAND